MGIGLRGLSSALVVVAAACGFPDAATAQSAAGSSLRGFAPLQETFNRAFFENDPEFFYNRSAPRQLNLILGNGSLSGSAFPENEITRDSELVHILYRDALEQQVSSDPILRTPDLPNPYNNSLLSSPALNPNTRVQGSELIFETLPPQ